MSQCHPALLIGDVLICVFSYLPKSALAAAAITCRTWSDLALQALWNDVDLKSVLSVFSPIVEVRKPRTSLMFEKGATLTNEDWRRFRVVARHVRHVTFPLGSLLHHTVFEAVRNSSFSTIPIFPNLRELQWAGDCYNSTYFMGTSLRLLDITLFATGWTSDQDIDPVVSQIAVLAPNLTTLSLTSHTLHIQTINALVNMLQLLKALNCISLSLSSSHVDLVLLISALEELPDLQELVLHYLESSKPLTWKPLLPKLFPSLRRITFTTPTSTNIKEYLSNLVPSGQLTEVTIAKEIRLEDWMSDPAEILEVAGTRTQLESFRMYTMNKRIALSLLVLEPVASCARLRILDICVGGQMLITDDDVEFLASGLPLLTYLRLAPSRGSIKAVATLRAFAIVAKWCPSITSIALQVDARANVPSPRLDRRHCNLRLVDVRRSHISHSRSVATFFDELSEVEDLRIAYLRLDRGKDPQRQRVWKEVTEWLPILRKVRVPR
ncbi:hypothetical protein FRB95_014544 [Tulasnella sp. JGI-2019a]|nr:hypothetical protein FRB95_014544 [Tulasnella sp. JGI-2019a]